MDQNWDREENEVASAWVKWNKPLEDKVFGTLVNKRTMKSSIPGQEGKTTNVYDLKADMGTYHVLDDMKKIVETPVVVEKGAFLSIGGTNVIDRQMQNVKLGQKIGLKFIEERPSKTKGFAPAKIVKVYAPKNPDGTVMMDDEFLAQLQLEEFDK